MDALQSYIHFEGVWEFSASQNSLKRDGSQARNELPARSPRRQAEPGK